MLRILVQRGVQLGESSTRGFTPLHYTAYTG